ncbi:hypothetical protein IKF03_02620 [Candidatus Saccharibacteria bacterium]|nr:hypothetical protein [Candidatus Saccharibacteria bacterium]
MKIIELKKVPKNKIGKLNKNGVKLESHEENTAELLTLYGFNIEVIRPGNTPKTKNPDFLINGAIWETKSPMTSNKKTLKKRMHEASEQAGRIIVDLRRVKSASQIAEKEIIKRFISKRTLRNMILIKSDDLVLEYRK